LTGAGGHGKTTDMSASLLGIDVGTQGSKCVLLDRDLRVVARDYEPNAVSTPQPGYVEQEAEGVWWYGVCRMLARFGRREGVDLRHIAGIGVTALFPEMLPLDANGRALRPAILYGIDTRAQREIREASEHLGEEGILNRSKTLLTSQSVGPKVLWFRRHEPEGFARTACIMSASNYITYRLTGKQTMDRVTAAFYAPFYDYDRGEWSEQALAAFGLDASLFPELSPPEEVVGRTTKEASRRTGLPEGIPVVAGSGDGIGEMLSQGVAEAGDMSIMYGTFGASYAVTEAPLAHRDMWVFPYLEGLHCIGGGIAATGAVTKWFVEQLRGSREAGRGKGDKSGREQQEEGESFFADYARFAQEAEGIPAGSGGLLALPFFKGEQPPYNDPDARGVLVGLTTDHDYRHVYRALLEATGYSFRHIIEEIRRAGREVSDIRASGGGTKNPVWMQLVSDITRRPQHIPDSEGAAVGAAYLAGLGVGRLESLGDIRSHVRVSATYDPDPDRSALYEQYYALFEELHGATKPFMQSLSRLGSPLS
jgi:xylulokinase